MPLDAALNTDAFAAPSQGADATDSADLQAHITNPQVYAAAQSIINYHLNPKRTGAGFKIEAFDVPYDALQSVADQLDELGTSHAVKVTLLRPLKDYVLSKGGSFARSTCAKPIYIALEVGSKKPEYRFEQGQVEMAAIDGYSALVEGASMINVRLTTSGTAMTTNQADVDRMFANVKGDKLWVRFEAPSKDELNGLMNEQEIALTAIGETIGGAVSAEDLKNILEDMKQDGLVNDDVVALLENMIELRMLAEAGATAETTPRINELAETIKEQIAAGIGQGTIPPVLAAGITDSLSALAETHNLGHVITPEIITELEQAIDVADLTGKLEDILGDLDPEADSAQIEALEEIIENIEALEGQELAGFLETLDEKLMAIELPEPLQAAIEAITEQAETISADITANLPEPAALDALSEHIDLAAEDIVELLQQLNNIAIEELPAELASVLDTLTEALAAQGIDIETLTADKLKDMTAAPENTIADIIQDIVIAVNNPDVQMALPQETLDSVNRFVKNNDVLVETAIALEVTETLHDVLENNDITPEQIEAIQQIIEHIENGGTIETIEPEILQAVKEIAGDINMPLVAAELHTALEIIEYHQSEPVILAAETLAQIAEIDMGLAEIADILQARNDPTPEQTELAEKIETIREKLEADPANIEALAELSALAAQLDAPEMTAIIPDTAAAALENLVPEIAHIVQVQETALSIKHDIPAAQIQDTVEIITVLESLQDHSAFEGVESMEGTADIARIIETLQSDPSSIEAAIEITKLQTALESADLPPEIVTAITEQLGDKLDAVSGAQIEALATQTGIEPEIVSQNIEIVAGIEAQPAVLEALSEAGIDLQEMTMDLGTPEGLADIMALAEVIRNSPEIAEALPPETLSKIEAVTEASVEAVAANIVAESPNLDLQTVMQVVSETAQISAAIEAAPKIMMALEEAGIPAERAEQVLADIAAEPDMAALTALDEIVQASPEIADMLAEKGIDLPSLTAAQNEIVAAQLNIEPEAVSTIREVQGVLNDPDVSAALQNAGIDLPEIITADAEGEASVDMTTLADMTRLQTMIEDGTLPPETAAVIKEALGDQLQGAIEASTQIMVADMAQAAPSVDITVIEAAVADMAQCAGIAEDAPAIIETLQEAGVTLEQAEQIIEFMQEPATLSTIAAIDEIAQANPVIAEVLAEQGVDLATLTEAQTTMAAVQMNIDPARVENIREVQAMIKDPEIAAVIEQAGIELPDSISAPDSAAITPEIVEQVIALSQSANEGAVTPATAEKLAALEERVINDVAATLDLEPAEIKQMAASSEGMASITSAIEAVQATAQTESAVAAPEAAAPIRESIAAAPVNEAQQIKIEAVIEKIETGEALNAQDIATLNEVSDSLSGPAKAQMEQTVAHIIETVTPADQQGPASAQNVSALDTAVKVVKPEVLVSQLEAIAQQIAPAKVEGQPLAASEKVTIESLQHAIEKLEAASADGAEIAPAEAEAILLHLDTAGKAFEAAPEIMQQIAEIRTQVIENTEGGAQKLEAETVKGPCAGCNGDCGVCKDGFKRAAEGVDAPSAAETVIKVEGLESFGFSNDAVAENKGAAIKMPETTMATQMDRLDGILVQMKEGLAPKTPQMAANDSAPQISTADKAPLEALAAASRTLETVREADTIPPAKAEAAVRMLNDAMTGAKTPEMVAEITAIRDQLIEKTEGGPESLPEEIRGGPCEGCKRGSCDGCGPNFAAVTKNGPSAQETVMKVDGLGSFGMGDQQGNNKPAAPLQAEVPKSSPPPAQMLDQIVLNMKAEAMAGPQQQTPTQSKAPIEAAMSAARMLQQEAGKQIPPAKAEVIIRKLDDSLQGVKSPQIASAIESLRNDVMNHTEGGPKSLPEDVQAGPCGGCTTGDCVNCGSKFAEANKEAALETVNKVGDDLGGYGVNDTNRNQPEIITTEPDTDIGGGEPDWTKEDRPETGGGGPCGTCNLGTCDTCTLSFNTATSAAETVDKIAGLDNYSIDVEAKTETPAQVMPNMPKLNKAA